MPGSSSRSTRNTRLAINTRDASKIPTTYAAVCAKCGRMNTMACSVSLSLGVPNAFVTSTYRHGLEMSYFSSSSRAFGIRDDLRRIHALRPFTLSPLIPVNPKSILAKRLDSIGKRTPGTKCPSCASPGAAHRSTARSSILHRRVPGASCARCWGPSCRWRTSLQPNRLVP